MTQTTGFRQAPQLSAKDKFNTVDVELKNMQMAARMTQMMCQRLMESQKAMAEDMSRLFQLVTETQYKLLAAQEVAGLDPVRLAAAANTQRLKDFEEASDKEDIKDNFVSIDLVEPDSTVILTSTTSGESDQGIFRSRLKLADSGTPALIQGLVGKPVGTKFEIKLNNIDHVIELLGIRRPAPQPEATPPLSN